MDSAVLALVGFGLLLVALHSHSITKHLKRITHLVTNLAPLSAAVDSSVAVMASAVSKIQEDVAALAAASANQDAEVSAIVDRLQAGASALAATLVPAPVPAPPAA